MFVRYLASRCKQLLAVIEYSGHVERVKAHKCGGCGGLFLFHFRYQLCCDSLHSAIQRFESGERVVLTRLRGGTGGWVPERHVGRDGINRLPSCYTCIPIVVAQHDSYLQCKEVL